MTQKKALTIIGKACLALMNDVVIYFDHRFLTCVTPTLLSNYFSCCTYMVMVFGCTWKIPISSCQLLVNVFGACVCHPCFCLFLNQVQQKIAKA